MREICRTTPTVYKTRTDDRELSVRAILSSGDRDQAGELVHLDGLDFTSHERDPWVDLEHSGQLVGWGRKSLSKPGVYSVQKARLNFGTSAKPAMREVPVGTTYFDPRDRIQMQAFALVKADALPGVSLEFRPRVRKSVGWSDLEDREAFDYEQVDVLRWTLCARPVCESALTEDVTKAMPSDALSRILRDQRVHTGAGHEALHPVLFKALSASAPGRRVTVAVGKAMGTEDTVYDAPIDTATPDELATDTETDEVPAKPTVQAHYDVAQGILDLCDQARAKLESSEHVKGREFLLKQLDKLEAAAEDVKANGDKIDGELGGDKDAAETDTDTEGGEKEGDEEDDVEPDMDRDDEGTLKAVRPVYHRVLKARRRFKAHELDAGLAATQSAEEAAADARLEKARRKYRHQVAVNG